MVLVLRPHLNQNCTPEKLPRSKLTKCPEEEQQLNSLQGPLAVGRRKKIICKFARERVCEITSRRGQEDDEEMC